MVSVNSAQGQQGGEIRGVPFLRHITFGKSQVTGQPHTQNRLQFIDGQQRTRRFVMRAEGLLYAGRKIYSQGALLNFAQPSNEHTLKKRPAVDGIIQLSTRPKAGKNVAHIYLFLLVVTVDAPTLLSTGLAAA